MTRSRLSILIAASLLLCGQPVGARTLTIGSIAEDPSGEIATFFPLVDYLAHRLTEFGIDKGKVVVVGSILELAEQMKVHQIDLHIDSPYPSVRASDLSGSTIILRRWKGGKKEYRSLIVVRADSPIQTLGDLRGKIVAFEDEFSTSGYFLPKSALLEAGLKLRPCQKTVATTPPDEVSCVFVGEQGNIRAWVLRSKADAGSLGAHNFEKLLPREKQQVRILHETGPVPRQVVSVRPGLDRALTERIQRILTDMEHSEEGRKILAEFEETTRFDELPGGPEQALAPIRRLLRNADAAADRR